MLRPREVAWLVELVSRDPKIKTQDSLTPKPLPGPELPDHMLYHSGEKALGLNTGTKWIQGLEALQRFPQ